MVVNEYGPRGFQLMLAANVLEDRRIGLEQLYLSRDHDPLKELPVIVAPAKIGEGRCRHVGEAVKRNTASCEFVQEVERCWQRYQRLLYELQERVHLLHGPVHARGEVVGSDVFRK